jgi:hypothetical protein
MRELHGVWIPERDSSTDIKALALLFDKLYVLELDMFEYTARRNKRASPIRATDIAFLQKRGFFEECGFPFHEERKLEPLPQRPYWQYLGNKIDDLGYSCYGKKRFIDILDSKPTGARVFSDIVAHFIASEKNKDHPTVPICKTRFPIVKSTAPSRFSQTLLCVASKALPVPDDTCAWQDILDFKAEMQDKQWGFRRFVQTLASKQQSEAEIRDEIEWSLNEYTKAMALHKIKASQTFVDVFIISPLEIVENLVKLNWSKIAKGVLQVRKRKIELMEAEMKAPGRECAYLFDARKRFGGTRTA